MKYVKGRTCWYTHKEQSNPPRALHDRALASLFAPSGAPRTFLTPSIPLIRDPPALKPLKMTPLATRPHHAKANRPKQPIQSNNHNIQHTKDSPLHLLIQPPCRPIQTEAHDDNGKPQRGVVMMHIRDTTHSNERDVVQEPADDGVDTRVVDLVNVGLFEVVVAALPADGVEDDEESEDAKTGCAAPVHGGVAEEEVFDD